MKRSPLIPTLVLVVALTGCGGDEGAGSSTAGPDDPARIVIENFAFAPNALTVKVGQKISVTNRDRAAHTVTATGDAFDTGNLVGDQVVTFRVDEPGEYPYICELHQYMKGTVTVS